MKFLLHIYVAFRLYLIGYFFSKNTHDRESWGFYRINFQADDEEPEYALVDIDFSYNYKHWKDMTYMHGGQNEANHDLHRWTR